MRIKTKLLFCMAGIVIVILLTGILMSLEFSRVFKDSMLDRTKTVTADFVQRQAFTHLSEHDFQEENLSEKEKVFSDFFPDIDTQEIIRIKVWSTDTLIIYSDDKSIIGKRFPDNAQVRKAVLGAVGASIKPLEDPENIAEMGYEQLMEVYVPIRLNNKVVGVIETYTKLDFINEKIKQYNSELFIIFMVMITIILVLIAMMFSIMSRFMVKPILDLKKAADEIGEGNYNVKIVMSANDEIGSLARSFEQMRKEVKSSKEKLEEKSKFELKKSKEDAIKKEKEAKETKEEAARKVAMLKKLRKKGSETEISSAAKRIQQTIADVRKDIAKLRIDKKKR